MRRTADDLVDAIVASPIGASLLAALEVARPPFERPAWDPPVVSEPARVAEAASVVATMEMAELLEVQLGVAYQWAGAWIPDAPARLATVYRDVAARRPIAAAVVDRFGPELAARLDLGAQEVWTSSRLHGHRDPGSVIPADLDRVYCCGEFTWAGLWTTTAPPDRIHWPLLDHWEIEPATARWRLPVVGSPRVWRIDHPDDWAQLVATYPKPAGRHSGWELPGPNQHPEQTPELVERSGGRAQRLDDDRYLVPDWEAVARDVDGVHLSWMGHLTTEGFISDVPGGGVTMLRYWFAERTLWQRDVFGEPEPLPAPALDDPDRVSVNDEPVAVDVRSEAGRRERDLAWLRHKLGR